MRIAADRVGGLIAAARRAGRLPGAVAAWQVGGRSVEGVAAGDRRLRPAAPASSDTCYDLASLTKPLATLTLCLLASRDGRLDLGGPVGDVLPEAAGSPWGSVTPTQLLAHSAGLPAWTPLYVEPERTALDRLLGLSPVAAPGERALYSDAGFMLLGLLLERCFGRGLRELFRGRVAEPLGVAAELGYGPPAGRPLAGAADRPRAEEEMVARLAPGRGGPPPAAEGEPDDGNARWLGGAAGHAGLFGTARAVLRLASEYLPGGGSLVTAEEAALARTPHPASGEQVRALGWQLAATRGCSAGPALPADAIGHVGFTGTSAWLDPHRRAVLVLLGNRHHPGHRGVDLHPLRRAYHRVVLAGR